MSPAFLIAANPIRRGGYPWARPPATLSYGVTRHPYSLSGQDGIRWTVGRSFATHGAFAVRVSVWKSR